MSKIIHVAAAAFLITAPAWAQNETAQQGPQNQALKGRQENNSTHPVAGANSFTETQAIKQLEGKGYTRVTGLKKDDAGVWRGTATKNGKSGPVSVDYQGNVN